MKWAFLKVMGHVLRFLVYMKGEEVIKMIDQKKAEAAAVACAVCVSTSMEEEGLASACLWYAIGEDYAQALTWSEKKAFHALVVGAIAKYTKASQTFAKKLA
jgi:hypothetical protein